MREEGRGLSVLCCDLMWRWVFILSSLSLSQFYYLLTDHSLALPPSLPPFHRTDDGRRRTARSATGSSSRRRRRMKDRREGGRERGKEGRRGERKQF